jgi:hypothetical protein
MSEHETHRPDEGEARPDPQGRDRKERLLEEMHGDAASGAGATPSEATPDQATD